MPDRKDLIVLTADKDAEQSIKGLLENRQREFAIRAISYQCVAHPRHDNGVRASAHDFLRAFLNEYERALAIFDLEGCGLEEKRSAEQIEKNVEALLCINGWQGRCAAIVLEPELEIWLWDRHLNVRKAMNSVAAGEVKRILLSEGFLTTENDIKPTRPKEAFELLLRKNNQKRSSSLFAGLAKEIDMRQCSDRAFAKLLTTLREWFSI